MIRTPKLLRCTCRRAPSGVRYGWWLIAAVAGCASETNDPLVGNDESGSAGATAQGGTSFGAAGVGGSVGKAGASGTSSGAGGASATGGSSGSSAGSSGTGGTATAGSGAGGKSAGGTSAAGGGTSAGGTSSGASGSAGASQGGSGNAMCGAGVVFCDDFEDGNSTGWTKSGGTWSVVDDAGDGVYQGGDASEESYAGEAAWTDQTVEANVKVASFGGTSDSYRAGIMARHDGSSAFYVFAIGGDGNLTLRKSTSVPSGNSGTCSAVSAGIDATQWFTLKMSVSGAAASVNIKTYLNGVLKHDCTTTSSTVTSGSAGVLTYGSNTVARFDDVSVTTP